jgi:hypothetical protein
VISWPWMSKEGRYAKNLPMVNLLNLSAQLEGAVIAV